MVTALTKVKNEDIQTHTLFLKTDYFHMMIPPEDRFVEAVRDELEYKYIYPPSRYIWELN